jgi:predicted RNA-binding Zn ribbon-like protein
MESASQHQAPGELELVRSFVNTNDIEDRVDGVATPRLLEEWLDGHGLPHGAVSEGDLRRAVQLREALRALLLANNGEPLDPGARDTINSIAESIRLVVRFDEQGRPELTSEGDGVDAALGSLLAIVFRSMAEGTWSRLKACGADDCKWAFYDHSKNRSGTWCSMSVCGNRAKARAYRSRRKTGSATSE